LKHLAKIYVKDKILSIGSWM